MPLTERTARLAGILGYVTAAAMGLLTVLSAWIAWQPEIVYQVLLGSSAAHSLGWPAQAGLLVLGGVTFVMAQYTLWQMWRLFRRYARHEAFTAACAVAIRRVGLGLIALGCLSLISDPALTVLASIGQEQGSMVVSFSSNDVGLLLCGGLLWVIGQVMAEAARQADDLRAII
ncbi:MAG: DUF2975 domain-containing protein [Pseudomonadota bacterium]